MSGLSEAFTLSLPLTRPLVVVPAALALPGKADFEPIVHHELAHVRARDLTLASWVSWSSWAGSAVLIAAVFPLLFRGGSSVTFWYGTATLAVLGCTLAVIRARVLRLREHVADRVATVRMNDPAPMANLLGRDTEAVSRRALTTAIGQVFRVHPDRSLRREVADGAPIPDGGAFLLVAAVTYVSVTLISPLYVLVSNLWGWTSYTVPPLCGAVGALLGIVLTALWQGQAATGRNRLAFVAAAVVGLTSGTLANVPGLSVNIVRSASQARWWLVIILLAFAGAVWLLTVLAPREPASRGRRTLFALIGASLIGYVLARGIEAAILASAPSAVVEAQRTALRHGGVTDTVHPSLLVLALIGALAVSTGRPPRSLVREFAVPLAAGAAVAVPIFYLQYRHQVDADLAESLLGQRWWACAAAGWLVIAVIGVLRGRSGDRPGLAWAVPAGWATAMTLGVVLFVADVVITELPAHAWLGNLADYLVNPTRLLLVLTLVLTPVLVAGRSVIRYILDGRTGVHRAPGTVRFGARATAVLAATVAAVILTSSARAVTGRPGDNDRVEIVLDKWQPPPSAPPRETSGPLDPERDLSRAAAHRALKVAGAALPGWSAVKLEPGSNVRVSPAVCERASVNFDAKWKAVRTSPEQIAFRTTDKAVAPFTADLTLTLVAYPHAAALAENWADVAALANRCPELTFPDSRDSGGIAHRSMRIVSVTYGAAIVREIRTVIRGTDRSVVEVWHERCIAAGRNEVCGVWAAVAIDSLPRQRIAGLDRLLSDALSATVADLRKR
ncbi:hypothetical protein ACQP2Y_22105 [Actinoplanes sp. CA-051413]|uniref:hypothetical protein n=1 Tax=Actinoplanes sp. CA-051413 TaxID=3239899 RepID=UPI003D98926B